MKKITPRRRGGVGAWVVCIVLLLAFLSVMAMMPHVQNTTSAEASNIVSSLRNLQAGVLWYLNDSSADRSTSLTPRTNCLELVLKYQDNPDPKRWEGYFVYVMPRTWWVGYDAHRERQEIRQKLADRAPRTGLFGSPEFDLPPLTAYDRRWYTSRDNIVWMPVRLPVSVGEQHSARP